MTTILDILGKSTPVSERVAKRLGYVRGALACRVFFYQQLEDGVCRASNKSFEDALGMGAGTVSANLQWLRDNKYIKNTRPLVRGNRPNHYVVTEKFFTLLRSGDERSLSGDESNFREMNVHFREMNGKEDIKDSLNKNTKDFGKLCKLYENNFNLTLSPIIRDRIMAALDEYPFETIERAITIAVENDVRKWSYVDAILKNPLPPKRGKRKNERTNTNSGNSSGGAEATENIGPGTRAIQAKIARQRVGNGDDGQAD